jgi:heme/copper-type cytochrome/quinol oxidase subunit 2
MKKVILTVIAIPIILFVSVMTYRSTKSMYVAATIDDATVERFCSGAIDPDLKCWCLNEYARSCEKN